MCSMFVTVQEGKKSILSLSFIVYTKSDAQTRVSCFFILPSRVVHSLAKFLHPAKAA